MNINLFKKYPVFENFFSKDTNNREINIYCFENYQLTGHPEDAGAPRASAHVHNLYYPNVLLYNQTELILPLLERCMSLQQNTIYDNIDLFKCDRTTSLNNPKTIIDYPVFFFIYNVENYFHFIYDTLSYLISFQILQKRYPNIKLLTQYPQHKSEHYKFVLEFFELLDIEFIIADTKTLYKTIFVSTSYTHDIDSNLPPREELYEFYRQITDKIKTNIKTPEKIYISRRTWINNDHSNIGTNYTTRRKLENENELVKLLTINGYTEVFTENLSTIEKIIYFKNAKYIIGAIGGGIANVLFSPKSTKLITIVSPTFLDINKRFIYSLNNINTVYFNDCIHTDKGKYKKYIRVKADNLIGEIIENKEDGVIISYTDNFVSGWNMEQKYNQTFIKYNQIKLLDNGLNSPWKINLETFIKFIDLI